MRLTVPDIKPLLQPDDTGLCGPTCVAMAAGVTIDEAFQAIGVSGLKRAGTSTTDIARGLRKLGMQVGEERPFRHDRSNSSSIANLPRFAIMAVEDNRSSWGHWVLVKDGFVYDPGIGWPLPIRVYEDMVITRAYSRRYKRSRDASKRLKATWTAVLPIYGRKKR